VLTYYDFGIAGTHLNIVSLEAQLHQYTKLLNQNLAFNWT